MFNNFSIYLQNTIKVIIEINNGEWEPKYFNKDEGKLYTIQRSRDGATIWVANGSFFCDSIHDKRYFGLICRHIAWWGAIKWFKNKIEYKEAIRL